MAESKEELKSLLMRVKEESEKASLKPQRSKNEDPPPGLHLNVISSRNSSQASEILPPIP